MLDINATLEIVRGEYVKYMGLMAEAESPSARAAYSVIAAAIGDEVQRLRLLAAEVIND